MDPRTIIPSAVITALTAALNGGAFGAGVSFTPERAWLPEYDVEQYVNLTVLVVLTSWEKEPLSPRDNKWTVQVGVGLVQHVGANKDNATIDPLSAIVNTIASKDVLEKSLLLPNNRFASWIATASNPHFDANRLSTKNVFFSRTEFTYYTVVPR